MMLLDTPTRSTKQMFHEALDDLPENATLEEIEEELAIFAALQKSFKELDAGKVITHEEFKARPRPWLTK